MSISSFIGPTITSQVVQPAANFTTTSPTAVDVTGWSVTLPNRKNGKALVMFYILYNNSGANGLTNFNILDNGVQSTTGISQVQDFGAAAPCSVTIPLVTSLNGQVVKLQTASIGGVNTVTVYGTNATINGVLTTLEIS